jgi:uncharacterized membrane protein required for colicin V production
MNLADIVIVLLLLLFVLGGIRRGLLWELLTAIGLLAGFGLVYYYRAELVDIAMRLSNPGWQRQWAGSLIFLFVFLVVYLGFSVLGRHVHEAVDKTVLKWGDRILGAVGGAIKGAVLIGIVVMMVNWMDGSMQVKRFLWNSQLVRWGKQAVYNLTHWESRENRQWVMANDDRGTMTEEPRAVIA